MIRSRLILLKNFRIKGSAITNVNCTGISRHENMFLYVRSDTYIILTIAQKWNVSVVSAFVIAT